MPSHATSTRTRSEPDPACLGLTLPAFLRKLLTTSPDSVKILGLDGRVRFINTPGRVAMELEGIDIEDAFWWDIWPEEARSALQDAVGCGGKGASVRFDADCPTVTGRAKRWDVTVSPIAGPEGDIEALLVVSRDLGAEEAPQDCPA